MRKIRDNFTNSFRGKKIIITGHTGFKGSWLSFWLNKLGANVLGISDQILTYPSFFEACNIKKKINSSTLDIKNFKKLQKKVLTFKPDYIFHLAAQALVKKSYDQPLLTWQSNTLGTINLLETLRNYKTIGKTIEFVSGNEQIKTALARVVGGGNLPPIA